MDYKRNKRLFDDSFSRKLTVLAICGAVIAPISLIVWWYIWYSNIMVIAAIIGVGMVIGAVSMRPKVKDVNDQIDDAHKNFYDGTAEKLKYPNDFEEDSLSLWGFIEGNSQKILKSGEKLTDRVQFTLLYLKRSQLYVRSEICSLTEDATSVNEYNLSLAGMTVSVDAPSFTLTIVSKEETINLPIQAVDYQLEEYIAKIERQIKKSV